MQPGAPARAPGLHFVELTRQRPVMERPQRGVPLFVGFGARTSAAPASTRPAVEIDRWEQFCAWIHPEPDGFLEDAVNGFFANGGGRCVVLPLQRHRADRDLIEPFAEGGSAQDVSGIDLVCVPDAVGRLSSAPLEQVQSAIVSHCEDMGDRFAVLDLPLLDSGRPDARDEAAGAQRLRALLPRSHFAAAYYPAIHTEVPLGRRAAERHAFVPPCGHVAGIFARSDARHAGVHKAPANEIVEAALALARDFGEAEHAALNEAGINCIRSLPGRGIRVMGARTLSHQSGWRHVPVARVFIELTRWLRAGMADIFFESQTPALWQQVRRRLEAYCLDLMRAGALRAETPEEAFFVKCDAETNPPELRDSGRLVAEVGLAPSVPAEFVVVRITHDASGIAVTGI